jgi:thymidylate kinase
MHRRGELFVFEGPDGAGKTTLSRAFAVHLRKIGVQCEHVAFPGIEPGTLGNHVHQLHHSPGSSNIRTIDPTALQLLHVAAHVDTIESRIMPAIEDGRSVILDRFWWSTWVYGRFMGANPSTLQAMIELESIHWRNVRPSLLFLLQRDVATPESNANNQDRKALEYEGLAQRERQNHPIRSVVNNGTPTKVLRAIIHASQTILSRRGYNRSARRDKDCTDQQHLPLRVTEIRTSSPVVFGKLAPVKPSLVYDTYWRFAAERQLVFFRRLAGNPAPWTDDPILREYKFTNAYRASDRTSQYLIKQVIYEGDQSTEEVVFRALLFKIFNKIETWELLNRELGHLSLTDYSPSRYGAVLSQAIAKGTPIYSAAYMMPSGGHSSTFPNKHRMHLSLLEQMMRDRLPSRLSETSSMKQAFELLRGYPTIGNFLAYQYVTDLNYSNILDFSEAEFVVPGPGARDGIRKCFHHLGGLNEAELIKEIANRQEHEFSRLGLDFRSLWGRPLQLIDCQNLFCEVDKYARVKHPAISGITGRTRIKQKYRGGGVPLELWYPPKWGLNEHIAAWRDNV